MRSILILLTIGWPLLAQNNFLVGVGGITACEGKHGSCQSRLCSFEKQLPLHRFLKKEAPNVNAISVWITRKWEECWYPAPMINEGIQKGYTPIFIFYWFADDISDAFIQKKKEDYFKTLQRFVDYLKKIKGPKVVILNPEFNENGVEKLKSFDYLQARSILMIKEQVEDVKVGICPGDFGDYKKIWDPQNWENFAPSVKVSAQLSDFIAFQEMRALTRNKKSEIADTPLRSLAFAVYLHKKYNKPTLLAYIAVSSYKDEALQADVFNEYAKLMPLFKESAKLIGVNAFHYIDVPDHKGYFNEAEKHFGLKKADGTPKPSFKAFLRIR